MLSPKNERNLIAGLRRGDTDALRSVYALYSPRVYGFALRLTGSRMDAEDLTQEVFIAAHAGRAGFTGRSRLLTWLLGIAVRRWRDINRRGAVESVPLLEEREFELARCGGGERDRTGQPRTMEGQAIQAVLLERALAELGDQERAALLLVASQQLTYKEAAELLGEPVGTVKWRVATASRRMQTILTGYDNEGENENETKQEDKADAVQPMQR